LYFFKDNSGIATETAYPYEGQDGVCRPFNRSGATVSGYSDILPGNESDLKNVVALIGPVSAAVDASRRSFQFYKGGIYSDPLCSQMHLSHAVKKNKGK
jgi:cathepsin L